MSQETDRLLHRINNQVPYCYSGRDGELQPVSNRVETWTLICQRVERGEINEDDVLKLEVQIGNRKRKINTTTKKGGRSFYGKRMFEIAERVLLGAAT